MNWSDPLQGMAPSDSSNTQAIPPWSLEHAEALAVLGAFTAAGLRATSEIWGKVEFSDQEDREDAIELGTELVDRLGREGLHAGGASAKYACVLVHDWQLPIYNLEFSIIPYPWRS